MVNYYITVSNIYLFLCHSNKQLVIMLSIENIRFLYKNQGILDRINNPEMTLRLVIDQNFWLPLVRGTTKQNLTIWNEPLPQIQLNAYQKQYTIQFYIYREGVLIGNGITSIGYQQTLKEYMDILDRSNGSVGKIMYECYWKPSYGGNIITYQQFVATKELNIKNGGKKTIIVEVLPEKQSEKKKYIKRQGDQNCGGFCGCFAVRKKKTQKRIDQAYVEPQIAPQIIQQMMPAKQQQKVSAASPANYPVRQEGIKIIVGSEKSKNVPILIGEKQLIGNNLKPVQPMRKLSYFSKTHVLSQ